MKKLYLSFFLSFVFFFAPLADANESVSIQLKWKHCFQFAGYYAAIEKGFYAKEGLDVTLKEIDLKHSYIKDVVEGKSQYGVSDSAVLVHWLKKDPVVLVTQIFQYSPLVLISHKDSNITTPYDMIGKKIMYALHKTGGIPFTALFLKTIKDFKKLHISEFTNYQDFIDRKVDVTSAYITSQPYWLKKKGILVNIIDPKSYGIDLYGDNLFTTQKELKEHPYRVEKMRRATLEGWKYALSHQDEMIDLILQKYAPQKNRDVLSYEARGIYQMIMPDLIDLGSINREKYQKIVKIYNELHIVNTDKLDDSFFYKPISQKVFLTKKEKKYIASHPIIKVGGGPDWAPFDFVNSDGIYSGVANDYLKLISKKTGLKFDVIIDKWSNNLQKIKEKKIDLLHAVYFTKKRTKFLDYTQAYFEMLDYFFIRNDLDVKTLKDLNGKRVAIPKGYAHEEIIKTYFPKIKIITVDTFDEAIDAVVEKKADILFDTYTAISYVLKKAAINTIIPFKSYRSKEKLKLHMASYKNNPTLISIINKGLQAITQDEKNKIYTKWIGSIPKIKQDILLNDKEKKWLKLHPHITITGNPNWLPFESFNKEGKYTGVIADYLKEIEKNVDITFKPYAPKSYNEVLKLSKNSKIDIISGDISDSVLRENYQPISPLFKTPVVIVMNEHHKFVNDLEDIKKQKIAIISSYSYTDKIIQAYPNIQFIKIPNALNALKLLSSNKIDALLLSLPKATYDIRHEGFVNIKIVGKTKIQIDETLFVAKNKPILYSILQKAVNQLKSDEILNKWQQEVKFAKETDYTLILQLVSIFTLFLIGAMYWNAKLSKEIEKRKESEKQTELLNKQLLKAKIQAEKANQSKSIFLANMSHEIRTPMNAVIGFAQLLSKMIKDPIQKDYLKAIQDGGESLLAIINDILDLSKIEAGKLEIILESVNINRFMQEIESIFSVKLTQKNLNFTINIDEDIPKYLLLDTVRLRQILFNLIGNAIKFTPRGSITLDVQKVAQDIEKGKIDLCFTIKDTGIGIEAENLDTIFETFEQQQGQNSQIYGGTGLGLAICKKLLSIMNGTITVESQAGKGSIFKVNLKNIAISSIEDKKNEIVHKIDHIQFEKATILIVDDIKDNRKLIQAILDKYNLTSVEALNGKDALEKLKNNKIDLILMDLKMPVMNGYESTRLIKKNPKTKHIPIIAITASVMGKDMQKIKEYAFDGYLRKPVTYDELLSQLAKFLKNKMQSIEEKNQDNISDLGYQNLPNLIKILKNEYLQNWHKIKDMGDFTLIKSFADRLEELGKKSDIAFLTHYAKTLQTSCESFDIEKIDYLMNNYPPLIDKMEKLLKNGKNNV